MSVDDALQDWTPPGGAAFPAGGDIDSILPDWNPSSSASREPERGMFSDIKPEIGRTYQRNVDTVKEGLSPSGRGLKSPLEGTLEAGKAIAAIPGALLSPITGAARSLVGHPLASAIHGAGELINPQAAAKDNPQEMYQSAANAAETAIGLGMPRGGLPVALGKATLPPRAPPTPGRFSPFTQAGQETLAGTMLKGRASDPQATIQSLSQPAELVPGSKPTTFQQAGDMGLGSLEREVATKNPADFMQRRAEQNAARVGALGGIQETGDPSAVTGALRNQLRQIDTDTQAALDQRLAEAQGQAAGLGSGMTPEAHGNALRSALQTAETTARASEGRLWRAVDPDGTLAVGIDPVRQAAQSVYGNLTRAASAGLKPIEHEITNVVGRYNDVEPFKEVTDLRSLVSSALREELSTSGRTPTYARLSQLRGSIEGIIDEGVQNRLAEEARAVQAGTLNPQETVAVRLQQEAADQLAARRGAEARSAGVSGARAAPVSPASRGQVPPSGRPGNAPGDQGVPPLDVNFDQAAADRLAAASAATKERAQTFGAPAVKPILRKEGQQGPYALRESLVPFKVFHPGASGFEDVQAFRKAAGDEQALPLLRDYAADSMRQAALRPDGTIDPAKFEKWQAAHSEAMRAFPELQSKFSDAVSATRSLEDVASLAKESRENAQAGVLGRLINAAPEDIPKVVGGIFGARDSTAQMRKLATQISDPAAMDGLRRAVVDFMLGKLKGNTEAGTSGQTLLKSDQFQTFVRQNEGALSQVFSPDEINSLKAIAADLQRANRSTVAVKLPGQSNTTQDLLAAKKNEGSFFSKMVPMWAAEKAGETLGGLVHGWLGSFIGSAAGVVGRGLYTSLRDAGLAKVDDLVKEAMLNPEIARSLLQKVTTPKQASGVASTLTTRIRRTIRPRVRVSTSSDRREDEKKKAKGGRVWRTRHERVKAALDRHGVTL